MRGRADMPSAKKSLGSSGSYLAWLAIFWRQAAKSNTSTMAPHRFASPRDIDKLPWFQRVEKIAHFIEVEFRIARLNDEEEFVARSLIEAPQIEDGVIRHRQTVEGEHAEHGA